MPAIYRTMNDSPRKSAAWTPSDTTFLPAGVRGIIIGTAGDVAIEYADGSEDVLPFDARAYYGLDRPRKIKATGTTATNIHLLF